MTAAGTAGQSGRSAGGVLSADPKRFDADAAGIGALIAIRCDECGTTVFGSHRACLACASVHVHRVPVSGRGTVLSYSTVHRASRDWCRTVPYTVAEVQTDDDVVVIAGMVDIEPGEVAVGLPVELRHVLVEHPAVDAWVAVFQWAPLRPSEPRS
jgi:uncharacterized protein